MQSQNSSNFPASAPASAPFSVGMGAGVVNYQISQQLSALKKSTQHCQVFYRYHENLCKCYYCLFFAISHIYIYSSFSDIYRAT